MKNITEFLDYLNISRIFMSVFYLYLNNLIKERCFNMKKNKGGAIGYVILVIAIVAVILASMATFVQGNTAQARFQKENREGYYLARSGVEMMYEHLRKNNLMQEFIDKDAIPGVEFKNYRFSGGGNGAVDVTATAVDVPKSDNRIVTIQSIAKLDNSSNQEVLSLRFELAVVRDKDDPSKKVLDGTTPMRDFKWSR